MKKKEEIQEEDSGEGWLTSYADLMTLVACFFIMLTSFANYDTPAFKNMAKDVSKYFKGANLQAEKDEMTELITKLESITHDTDKVKITSSLDGAEIVFKSSYLFSSGSAEINPLTGETLILVIQAIMKKDKSFFIEVEGHADIQQYKNQNGKFTDNWMLSASRSAAVVKIFEDQGYPNTYMRSIGYGTSRPKHPHFDLQGRIIEENLEENRRVIIKITKVPKEGFGLLYDKAVTN